MLRNEREHSKRDKTVTTSKNKNQRQTIRLYNSFDQGCICQIFTGGGLQFRLAMTDRATIAGMEVAKLVPWNSLLN